MAARRVVSGLAPRLGAASSGSAPPRGRQWSTRAALAAVVGAVLVTLFSGPASAHQPWFNAEGSPDPSKPYRLPVGIDVSQVIYAGLPDAGRVDYYAFSAPAGAVLNAYLVVADACADFRPAFALFGPGLDPPAAEETPPLPDGVPTALTADGAVAVDGEEWGTFYEPFTGSTFLTGPRLGTKLAGGDYVMAVYDTSGGSGTYGLTVGLEEIFGGEVAAFATRFGAWERCEPLAGAAA